ncbi:MAG: SOS response-associated peptidase [Ignavibacteria bacterium]|nr:SOS response-associated peptidase [Ignavibacteria bacterium]
MCGRYTLFGNWKSALPPDIIFDELIEFQDIVDNYNVTPLHTMPILKAVNHDIHATAMRWGFVPAWSKESAPQGMINARSETVSEKPSFRHAFKQRRCLIPMNGFYEWASSPYGKKQPVYCSSSQGELLFAAGIWEHWSSPDKSISFDSFAIITVPANSVMRAFHERMPAFINKDSFQSWLFDSEHAAGLLLPRPNSDCRAIYVGTGVNNARMNNPELILECLPIIKSNEIIPSKPPSGGINRRNSNDNSEQGALF